MTSSHDPEPDHGSGVQSAPELLVLHGVRILGSPSVDAIAARFGLDRSFVREALLDAQAVGWVSRHDLFGETWSLTERGRAENERQLAAELKAVAAEPLLRAVHRDFGPLNQRHGVACTDWQLRPVAGRRIFNDHSDPVWDDRVLLDLTAVDAELAALCRRLTAVLVRFGGHAERHHAALAQVRQGRLEWLDAPDRDSCQLVWMQFHEDLLATLGLPRGSDS